jgi:predicted double-glycine peptidase/uncharacterized protein YpmS
MENIRFIREGDKLKNFRKKSSFIIILLLSIFVLCGAAAATSTPVNNTQTLSQNVHVTTSTSPITSKASTTTTSQVSIADIKVSATKVKNFINTNKRLPNYVTLNGKQVGMASFLHILTRATILVYTNKNVSLKIPSDTLPTTTTENMSSGTVNKASYVGLAYRIADFMNRNNKAPIYAKLNLGTASYKTQISIFCTVLDYYNTNNRLPNYVQVTPFYGSVIKAGWVNVSKLIYYQQPNSYSCGPSSLKMVLSAYGLTVSESWLEKIAGTTSSDGTTHSGLINAVNSINSAYGTHFTAWDENISARYWSGLYTQFISKGRPVILHVKSWLYSGGHYVVLSGLNMNEQLVRLADPSYGGYRTVTFAELESRMSWITSTGRSNNPIIVIST